MRATSPADSIAVDQSLQLPIFKVGDMVKPGYDWKMNFAYYLKRYARYLIGVKRGMRTVPSKGKLAPHIKGMIQDCLTTFCEATVFQVAGVYVQYGHNLDYTGSNVCYLRDILGCSSGPSYAVQLLVRFEREGKSLGLIVGMGIGESSLRLANKKTVAQILTDNCKVAVTYAQARRLVNSSAVQVDGKCIKSAFEEISLDSPVHILVGKNQEFTVDETE